ncbi:hypothetical protein XELAEV_18012851mg [Xenopus laevis]|uniref:Uncharacterized protein n=1 Tax=Xenopus laevis TaxID=8355 RepID=A0A974DNW5_XENLA|nr:hypothetical protein XELAEV_18012851mg [Xenopus laevis]
MDPEQNNSSQKTSENYIWLAPCIAGGILIFLFISILGIVLWKCLKKPNISEENWAGPSPLADVECSNSRVNSKEFNLGIKCMPLACMNTVPGTCDKSHILQEEYTLTNGLNQENMEKERTTTKPMAARIKCIPVPFPTVDETTDISCSGPASQSPTLPAYLVDSDLPPPPDHLLD